MNHLLRKFFIPVAGLFLLVGVLLATATAADLAPNTRRPGQRSKTYSVAEPAAIALLGTGLVSLGIYAKKKRAKKQ